MSTARWLLALSAVLIHSIFAAQSVSAQGTLTGDIPPDGGVVPVQWSGGSIDALRAAAEDAGCDLSAVLLDVGGTSRTYVVGAPGFVNTAWTAQVGPEIEATPLSVVCDTPGLESESCVRAFWDANGRIYGAPGADTSWEALQGRNQGLRILPEGTFVEAEVSDSRVTWELVAHHGGAVVGSFSVKRDDFGWWPDGGVWCWFRFDGIVVDHAGGQDFRIDRCADSGPVPELTIIGGTLPVSGFAVVRTDSALTVDDLGRALKALNVRMASVFRDGLQVAFTCDSRNILNRAFRELFADGLPAGQILTVRTGD